MSKAKLYEWRFSAFENAIKKPSKWRAFFYSLMQTKIIRPVLLSELHPFS